MLFQASVSVIEFECWNVRKSETETVNNAHVQRAIGKTDANVNATENGSVDVLELENVFESEFALPWNDVCVENYVLHCNFEIFGLDSDCDSCGSFSVSVSMIASCCLTWLERRVLGMGCFFFEFQGGRFALHPACEDEEL